MARKPSDITPSERIPEGWKLIPLPDPPQEKHLVKLAHPEEMPAELDAHTAEGWQIITIVPCRHTHEHAAYFRRLTPAP